MSVITEKDLIQALKDAREPNYANPKLRSPIGKYNDFLYEIRNNLLRNKLKNLSLLDALETLHQQQMDAGFIQYDFSEAKSFQCRNQEGDAFFLGQYNPRRAERSKGAGRENPPPGIQTKDTPNTNCFLCPDNIRWQHRGIQLYYQFLIDVRKYNALCNPFPFMPFHITIASHLHEPQSWHEFSHFVSKEEKIKILVNDLYYLSSKIKGFVGFYNGVGSGASIEKHFHYHFFKVPSGHPPKFPLQMAAERAKGARGGCNKSKKYIKIKSPTYPLTAFKLYGNPDEVKSHTIELIRKWNELSKESASANIIAVWEDDHICFYFVPRNRFFSRSPGLSGTVGGLEALGELIFCSKSEDQAILKQEVNYDYIWCILQAVDAPKAHKLDL